MPAYVPPALRGVAGQQAEAQQDRRIWRCKLEFATGGPFVADDCPETLLETSEADQLSEATVRSFELPSEVSTSELKQLLTWFAKASSVPSEQHPHGDARARLLFPPVLSKDSRKLVHGLAEGLQLPTFSKGLGEERRLAVHGAAFRGTPEMECELAAAAARRRAPAAVRERAKQIWRWCQAEGGALWQLSQGELEEALLTAADESALPPAVKDLLERREHGAALMSAIRSGDTAAAMAVLEAHPRAAWMRDEPGPPVGPAGGSGGGGAHRDASPSVGGARGGGGGAGGAEDHGYYPLHLAALAGMGEVVDKIASQPGAVEQRDKLYATPLKVAKKAGQAGMVEILLRHGAKDYEINQAAHKTAAIGIPVPAPTGGRRLSNSHAMSGSPPSGSPSLSAGTGGGASTASPHFGGSFMAAHAAARQRRVSGDVTHGSGSHHGPTGHRPSASGHQPSHLHPHAGQHHHGPSSLGSAGSAGHRPAGHHGGGGGGGGGGRRSLDEHPPAAHPHGTPPNDPTINPFAVLAGGSPGGGGGSSGGDDDNGRSSAGSAAAPGKAEVAGSDSDSSAGGAGVGRGAGGFGVRGGRARVSGARCALPPIQSGEVSEASVVAALAAMGLSSKPGLETAAEVPEAAEAGAAGGAAGSDDDEDDGAGAGEDGTAKKRKTRRGRRGRGNRRHSVATTDEAAAAVAAAAASAAEVTVKNPVVGKLRASADGNEGLVGSAPSGASGAQLMTAYMARRRSGTGGAKARSKAGSSAAGDSSSGSDSDSDLSAGGSSRARRGGQPARARRHERRRAARAGSGGGDGAADRPGGNGSGERHRRGSGADYSSFHHGHGHGHGGKGSNQGGGGGGGHGHYHVYGGAHHGHADDAASWRRDPAAAAAAGSIAPASPMTHADEPRAPAAAAGRPPAPRRMSAGPGMPPLPPAAGSVAGVGSGGGAGVGAMPEAPSSPFHHGLAHGPRATGEREHVAVGPAAGQGFGFGRGRGRGVVAAIPASGPIAPGSAPAVAPGAIASAAGGPAAEAAPVPVAPQ